jgi:RimJ/RimL family protein N-acetyltransferase
MDIREITASDAEEYFALRRKAQQEFPQFVGLSAERELAAGSTGIADLLARYPVEGTVVLGGFEHETLVGVVALTQRLDSPKYRHKAFLWGMYIVPEHRDGSVARPLMEAAIAWAAGRAGLLAITLQVTVSNVRARKFYDGFGFRCFGTEKRSLFAAGEFHDAHYMELEIKNA